MKYSIVLVLTVAVVMFAECCPIDSAVSEIEMLEWLDNPEASLRDLKQETEDLEWLDSPLTHISDVRSVKRQQEDIPLEINKMEQVPAEEVKPTNNHKTVSPIPMPKEEQASAQVSQEEQKLVKSLVEPVDQQQPEQIPVSEQKPEEEQNPAKTSLVSQDQQEPEQNPMGTINTEQLPIEENKFDRITHQHHHARPTTLPDLIQVEKRPDQIPIVLEQVPGTERKPAPVLIEEKKPENVPGVSVQVPVNEPQLEQVPVENNKPEQVFFEQKKPENPVILEDQQKPEQAVVTEASEKTQVDPIKKQMPSTISPVPVHTHKLNHSSPTSFEESGCFWSGTAPFCRGNCGRFYSVKAVDKMGDGKTCLTGTKKLCCPISLTSLIG